MVMIKRYFAEFNFSYNGSERFHKKIASVSSLLGAAWMISNVILEES